MSAGAIPIGRIFNQDIRNLTPDDLRPYDQVHFFAGIGGWPLALELAGWNAPCWTGSCPCQPFSVAGRGKGQADERHLWPDFARLIGECAPPVVFGEQVAAAVGKSWLDGVCADLEGFDYAVGAAITPACAVDAPHRRDRLWFVADATLGADERRQSRASVGPVAESDDGRNAGALADASRGRRARPGEGQGQLAGGAETVGAGGRTLGDANLAGAGERREQRNGKFSGACSDQTAGDAMADTLRAGRPERGSVAGSRPSAWDGSAWLVGADGKARRVKPGIRLLAHGIPNRVGALRGYGNAIVPQQAAAFVKAYMEARLDRTD